MYYTQQNSFLLSCQLLWHEVKVNSIQCKTIGNKMVITFRNEPYPHTSLQEFINFLWHQKSYKNISSQYQEKTPLFPERCV